MSNWAAMSMRRLVGRSEKYPTWAACVTAAAGRFHPNIGGRISIVRGGESPIHAGKSPLPLAILPQEMVTDMCGDTTTNNSHFNFMRIEKQVPGVMHRKIFIVEKNNKLPWEDGICRGSSHGWLAFVHPSTRELGLFNPFLLPNNNNSLVSFPYIPLPPSDTIKGLHSIFSFNSDSFVLNKLTLSCAPPLVGGEYEEEMDCNVVGISESTKKLLFCKLGDSTWTNLKGSFRQYSDVVYFSKHGCFYAVSSDSANIESWDFTNPCCPNNTLIQPSHEDRMFKTMPGSCIQFWGTKEINYDGQVFTGRAKTYLVEASGDLLLVLRTVTTDRFLLVNKEINWNHKGDDLNLEITTGFKVYKMDWSANRWERLMCLGDKALFLGLNHSFSVSTHDSPQVRPNSIYFTDDRDIKLNPQGYDSGLCYMENNFIYGILPASRKAIKQLPLWVLPNPN